MSGPAMRRAARRARGLAARLAGRRGELVAALWLMAKGYRILGLRLRTQAGEIDLVAHRGRVLAVVEVKLRTTLDGALEAVTRSQRDRLRRAGQLILKRRKGFQGTQVRLDLMALAPGRWPRHIPDAWNGA